MVGRKDHVIPIGQVKNHLVIAWTTQQPGTSGDEVIDRASSAKVCQSVLEGLSHRNFQLSPRFGFLLANRAKRFEAKGEFQMSPSSGKHLRQRA